ncbi:MAG: PAS domain S-box protein [Pirellulales bacterium]
MDQRNPKDILPQTETGDRLWVRYAREGILVLDRERHLLDANARASELLECDLAKWMGHFIADLPLPASWIGCEAGLRSVLPLVDSNRNDIPPSSSKCIQRNGLPPIDLEFRSDANALDQSLNWIIHLREPTHPTQTQTSENFRFHQFIVEEAGRLAKLGGWYFDVATGKGFWTDEVARIHDRDPAFPIDREQGLNFYVGESRERIEHALKQATEHGLPWDLELEIISAKGVRKWIRTMGQPIREGDRVVRVIGSFQDVTQQKKNEHDRLILATRLHAAMESMTDAIFISDAFGTPIELNDALVTFYQFNNKTDCLQAMTHLEDVVEYYSPMGELVPRQRHPLYRALRGESGDNLELEVRRKDTGSRWTGQFAFSPIFSLTNQIIGAVVVARDITVLKQNAMDLQASEQRFSRSFHSSPASQAIFTWPEGRVVDANDSFCKMLGYSRSELIGHPFTHFEFAMDDAVRQQLRSRLQTEHAIRNMEVDIRTRDGFDRTLLISIEPFDFKDCSQFILVALDVTDRKLALTTMQKNEEKVRYLLSFAPVSMAMVGNDGSVHFVNQFFHKSFGWNNEDIHSIDEWWEVAYPNADYRAQVMASWSRDIEASLQQGGVIDAREYKVTCKNGEVKTVEISGLVTEDGILATFMDLTEHRRAEESRQRLQEQLFQSQKMESVGRLAGGVAHDFNNILTVQLCYCELLMQSLQENDPIAEGLTQIKLSANRAAALTHQLLAFSRKQALHPKVIDLNLLVIQIEHMLRRLIGEDIDLVTQLSPMPAMVKADPSQMEQVIMNLAVNARDAMPHGGRLSIRIHHVQNSSDDLKPSEIPNGRFVVLTTRTTALEWMPTP